MQNLALLEKRSLGRTGLDVSVVGFGAAPVAYVGKDEDNAVRVVNRLLDAGLNLLDTAISYPNSHDFIGKHFSGRRADYVLVSKCGQRIEGFDAPGWSPQVVTESVERSLKALRTDHIDVMLLHSCDLKTLQKPGLIEALVAAKESGKIGHVGYSGDNEALTWAAGHEAIEVVETSVNIVDQVNIDAGVAVARKNNIGVIAKRPIANACWKKLQDQPGMYKEYASKYTDRLSKMNINPTSVGCTAIDWAEVALRFTLGQSGVTTAVIGTTNESNAMKNLEYAANGPLSAEAVDQIRAAFARAMNDEKWPGLT